MCLSGLMERRSASSKARHSWRNQPLHRTLRLADFLEFNVSSAAAAAERCGYAEASTCAVASLALPVHLAINSRFKLHRLNKLCGLAELASLARQGSPAAS